MLFSHQLQIVSKPKQFLADIQTFLRVTLYTRFLKTNFLKEDSLLLNFLVIYCRYQHSTQCANCLETKLGWERETAFALRAIGAAKAKLPRLQKKERTSALHNKLSLQQHYVMIFAIVLLLTYLKIVLFLLKKWAKSHLHCFVFANITLKLEK